MKRLEDILSLREDVDFEVKQAQGKDGNGEVPASFYETYAAMANTDGGVILLGVREEKDHSLMPLGLRRVDAVRKALWDNLNNRKVVSINLLDNRDIQVIDHAGKELLMVNVPRAARTQRPVYVGTNPLTGTYRRSYEGDYHCDEVTVRRLLAEASEDSRDARLLPAFGMEDLDPDSLAAYRNEFRSTKPGHPWLSLEDRELLRNLGGWRRDRQTDQECLTLAGILMFGRLRTILEAVPNYLVDYQERTGTDAHLRWSDRVTTDGTWSGNLFDFFRRVYPKLTESLKVPFRLEGGFKRIDESHVHEALREALVNCLIHADFSGNVGILIIRHVDHFTFRNPGAMRIPLHVVLAGGTSDCRNRTLQKMFQLVGAGEQAGSGIPKILRAWSEQHWRTPLLEQELVPEQTSLTLPMISLLPQEAIDTLDNLFGADFRNLDEVSRLAIATALIEGRVTNERLREITSTHPKDLTALLHALVDRRLLAQEGVGRGTYYHLAGKGPRVGPTPLFEVLTSDATSVEHLAASSEHLAVSSEHLAVSSEHLAAKVRNAGKAPREQVEEAILQLCAERFLTLRELAEALNRSTDSLRNHYIRRMVETSALSLRYPAAPNHPDQGYRAHRG